MDNNQYRRVLIPVQEREFLELLVKFIREFQWWGPDTEFKVLHVREPHPVALAPSAMGEVPIVWTETDDEAELGASRILVDSAIERLSDLPISSIEGHVETGTARDVIVQYARQWHADLIVMVSHGRHGIDRWLMGSVSSDVAGRVSCTTIVLSSKQQKAA